MKKMDLNWQLKSPLDEWWMVKSEVISSGLATKEKSMKIESDPNGKDPHQPGAKLDAGKICTFRGAIDYFPRAIEQVAAVSTFGATKYAWKGWETVPEGFERYSDAMVRHLTAASKGEFTDPDSGLSHAAHTAWNALARLELLLKGTEKLDPAKS